MKVLLAALTCFFVTSCSPVPEGEYLCSGDLTSMTFKPNRDVVLANKDTKSLGRYIVDGDEIIIGIDGEFLLFKIASNEEAGIMVEDYAALVSDTTECSRVQR